MTAPGKRASRRARPSTRSTRRSYAGGKLDGTFKQGKTQLKWLGERAPEIADKDDGSWKPGKPIELFNHKDLSGWRGTGPG